MPALQKQPQAPHFKEERERERERQRQGERVTLTSMCFAVWKSEAWVPNTRALRRPADRGSSRVKSEVFMSGAAISEARMAKGPSSNVMSHTPCRDPAKSYPVYRGEGEEEQESRQDGFHNDGLKAHNLVRRVQVGPSPRNHNKQKVYIAHTAHKLCTQYALSIASKD